jgi:hypothetical protein
MLCVRDLLELARLYGAAEGIALSTLGKKICNNSKIFSKLAGGGGANIHTVKRIETFFRAEWPEGTAWPADIPPGPAE